MTDKPFFEVVLDGERSTVQKTEREVNGFDVFYEFDEAKRAALVGLDSEIDSLVVGRRRIYRMQQAE